MKIKAYLIDVINETHKAVEIENKLADYYRELQCTVIDIQERKIGKKVFDIICDDEGLFKEPAKISAIDNLGTLQFAVIVRELVFNFDRLVGLVDNVD